MGVRGLFKSGCKPTREQGGDNKMSKPLNSQTHTTTDANSGYGEEFKSDRCIYHRNLSEFEQDLKVEIVVVLLC